MSIAEIQNTLEPLARRVDHDGEPMRTVFPRLIQLSRDSGRSLPWCECAFAALRSDIKRRRY